MKSTPKTKKKTKAQATMKAVATRIKHVRPNKATKENAVDAEGTTLVDIHGKLPVCVTSLTRLSAMMLTVEEIAGFYGISLSTMNRRLHQPEFRNAFDRGRAHGRVSLRFAQLQTAHAGNPTMLIWLGKQYLGQKTEHTVRLSAEDELPDMEGPRMVHIPWTEDLEREWNAIDAEFPEIPTDV